MLATFVRAPLMRAAATLLLGSLMAGAALAEAPFSKVNASGFQRLMLGSFEVTSLSDGTVALPMDKLLTNTTPEQTRKALARSYLSSPLETSVNAFLINTGTKLVLVDTGAGGLFGPTLGKLNASLRAAGYQPEQVDAVLITHMHADHVGGLIQGADAARAFPNATVHADQHEADFWLSAANMAKAPAANQDFFKAAQATLKPYVDAGRFKTFDGNTELMPGVRAQASRGHTAGHATYVIESQGQKLALWGDLMHVAAVQFANPMVTIQFDTDTQAAAAQRKLAFADAAKHGYLVAAAHLPFPGIGRLRVDGKGYDFVPLNYSTIAP